MPAARFGLRCRGRESEAAAGFYRAGERDTSRNSRRFRRNRHQSLQADAAEKLRRAELQRSGEAVERIERHHAVAAFDFANVVQAELRREGEFLLGKVAGPTLGAEDSAKLSLKLSGSIRHRSERKNIKFTGVVKFRLPTLVRIYPQAQRSP